MIEDRDGTVDAPSLLVVSIVLVENSVERSENENVRTTRIRMVRFKLNLLRDSTIPLLDRYTHTHTHHATLYTLSTDGWSGSNEYCRRLRNVRGGRKAATRIE